MYGAKHGGFTSLRELPGLLGGGCGGGRTVPATSGSPRGTGVNGQLASLGRDGFAGLTVASSGAPSAAYGPIGGPAPKATGGPNMSSASTAMTATCGGDSRAPTGYGGRPRTPPPLPPLQTKRSNRCVCVSLLRAWLGLPGSAMPATCGVDILLSTGESAAHTGCTSVCNPFPEDCQQQAPLHCDTLPHLLSQCFQQSE